MIDPLKQWLGRNEKVRLERDKQLANSIESVIRQQNLLGQISIVQQQKEILAFVYERASSYSNLVMIGGYAAMFAVWQLMKPHLSKGQELLIAALVTSSIILFAGFEIFKMISHALFFRRLDKIISSSIRDHERTQSWQIAWKDYSATESRIWVYFLIPTVITGFAAGFILLWIFLRSI
jgi:hypothetical protein